jgi:short subunit dehydrogenase-like uncharacterized protein
MKADAEFDVVIYGASGFTGRLVAEYMAGHYGPGSGVKWAMAGRSGEKLAAVRGEVGAPGDTELIIADAGDPDSIASMVRRAKCVITTVGPYTHYGEPLVAACAQAGTDYVDLCGEVLFMREMIDKYEATARQSGARIVFSCGFDSVPFDLGVQFLQEKANERFGGPCPRVRGRMRKMQGTFSGGTAASGAATMAAVQKDPSCLPILLDPFSLAGGFSGPEQPAGNKVEEDAALDAWVAPFVMAVINTKNIHRSNALMGHPWGESLVYDEMFLAGPGEEGKAAADAIAANSQIGGEDGPKPGEGPSRQEREAGHYDLLVHGTSADGQTIAVGVTGDMDPGYGSTSKMITEAALCLTRDCENLAGGIYTPASAMGASLRQRLVANAGLTFEVEA